MQRHVLFDFDGTLVDSLGLVVELYNELAQRHGWRVLTPDGLAAFRKMTLRERFQALELPFYRLPLIGRELKGMYAARMGNVGWIPGVVEALQTLDGEGVALGILSSNSVANIQAFLERQGMTLFRSVQSVTGLFGKHRVLARYMVSQGLNANQLVYVGDEQRDVEAARRAGIRSIAVTWGADTEEKLRALSPTTLVHSPSQLGDDALRLLRP